MPHPSGRPWIIAHRGASHDAAENTLAAFRLAADQGADGIELDVRRTADDRLVVHHDPRIGDATAIREVSLAEVRALAPEVPLLSDVLETCDDLWLDIEVKNSPLEPDWDPDDHTVRRILSMINERHLTRPPLITSFNPTTVAVAASSGARAGLLLGRGALPSGVSNVLDGLEFVLPHVDTIDGDDVGALVAASPLPIITWTTDDPSQIGRLIDAGVDGLITNRPTIAISVLGQDRNG